ncbi:MAG TPA: xanthine dehydrogenase family protein molybdopterin-binding subunit [Steroidobacteraceae bacterium]|nr:xanthine dehydrogenase family protein molybdopterin-binding subunit [Steroidobacteraceae bacterium]
MSEQPQARLDRRNFLIGGAVIGAGLYVGVRFANSRFDAAHAGATFQPNAFLRIAPDDTITVIIGKSEMGQGIYTGLPMAVAEELDVDPTRVQVEFAPADPAFNVPFAPVQFTGGSMSTSTTFMQLREAGARARAMLLAAAAKRWNVAPGTLRTGDGRVFNGDKSLTYGALADAASKETAPQEVALKNPAEFRHLGKPHKRLDAPMKVDGSAKFGLDQRLPGMLFAVVARSPYVGGKLTKFDDRAARAVPGVVDVKQIPSGIAVYATNTWAAKRGREALTLDWDGGKNATLDTESLRAQYRQLASQPGAVARDSGNVRIALGRAAKKLDVEYELPYLAHAPMEPLNCLADVRADGCDIYLGTQSQSPDRDAVAETLGMDPSKVHVHTAFLGGAFGRRAQRFSEVAVEAAQASKAVGKPVQVVWTREDDIQGLSYRPYVVSRVRAGIDAAGNPSGWQQCIVSQAVLRGGRFESFIPKGSRFDPSSVEGASDMPYAIPNILVDTHEGNPTVPILWWRSVGHSHTAFTVNCGIDELAALAGVDPVDMRRKLLVNEPRFLAVLNKVTEMCNWAGGSPAGRGRGVAIQKSFGSIVAEVAEVSVDGANVRVHKVWCAIDCGFAANPSGVIAQMESGINYGLTAALHGEISFANGRVVQSNFHDYPIVRIDEAPQIEVAIINSGEPMGGAGEPGTPPIAPAVANAIYAATGKRVRRLPILKNLV